MSSAAYRPDIDGLRAVAVLSVVFYHYGATWLPGGFTGVDVFFVISGYVITMSLRRDIEAGSFSLLRFYDRRVRRILPALLVVIISTLLAGWLLLMPGDYADMAESAAFASAGLSNLFFFANTGYFDQAAELQPLLHTWSLGVEEQFYFFWPLVLLTGTFLIRSSRWLLIAIVAATAAGLALAIYQVAVDPKSAFYLPHFRAWELAIGAAIAFAPNVQDQRAAQILPGTGMALIAASLVFVRPDHPFPGAAALPACVGAALIILPTSHQSSIAKVLAMKPFVAVGLLSYSLYLWHWPVLVLYRHYKYAAFPNVVEAAALLLLSLVCAFLSWRFVERPFRKSVLKPLKAVAAGVALVAATAFASIQIVQADGFDWRLPAERQAMSSLETMWEWNCPAHLNIPNEPRDYCNFGAPWDTADVRAFLWGDSHALHLVPLLNASPTAAQTSYFVYDECIAASGQLVTETSATDPAFADRCADMWQSAVDYLNENEDIEIVILSGFWTSRMEGLRRNASAIGNETDLELLAEGLQETIQSIDRPNRQIILVADMPYNLEGIRPTCSLPRYSLPIRGECGADSVGVPSQQFRQYQGGTYSLFTDLAEAFERVSVVLPGQRLCESARCLTEVNSQFIYRDNSHIRRNLSPDTYRELNDLTGLESALISAIADIR